MNPMLELRIDKVVVNIGVGEGGTKLDNSIQILKRLTGRTPVKTITMKRIPDFGVRPEMAVGCLLTLRGKEAEDFLKKALSAVENKLKGSCFDKEGNFSFGIREHIDIQGVKYDPALGTTGMDVCVSMGRRGDRIKRRKVKKAKPKRPLTPEQAIDFVKEKFGAVIV